MSYYTTREMAFINDLHACPPGARHARRFEIICANTLKYLFENEFSLTSEQHRVENGSQIMDLQCVLRGTTECWKALIHFHKTKYVVFEFKNHTIPIGQNHIHVTRKYLCPAVCRNIAFVISRKGFSKNAHYAAMRMLSDGLLIIDLTDTDLEEMLLLKLRGEEPSDYLMRKIDMLLMSASI